MYMATQAEGILVTAGQIYVRSLDAEPREEDIISGVASIDAGEVKADKIIVTDLELTGSLSASGDMELSAFTNVNRMTATQIGIGTTNPVNDFQVGTNRFVINRNLPNLVSVVGNVASTNVIASTILRTTNNKFVVNSGDSNVLKVTGNTYSTNLTVRDRLYVGSQGSTPSNIAHFQNGNVVIDNGDLRVFGNVIVAGNVSVTEDLTYKNSNNLVVSNAIIQMADGVPGGAYDSGLIMTDDPGVEANLVVGYSTGNTEFIFARTFGSAYTVGGIEIGSEIPLDSNTVNIHVYGKLYTESNVGVANIAPTHTMCIGSNVFFEETGSNVMHATGNVYVDRLVLGSGGILSTGGLLQLNPSADPPVQIGAAVQMNALRTIGTLSTGISNTSPIDDFSVGTKVFANLTEANVLTVVGNTVTTNLQTEIIFSESSLTVHADHTGSDSTSNTLVLKSGPTASNVSSIEVFGASTSNTHQNIRFKTKNTERLCIASTGKVGIANTNPSEALTVSGNVHVTGSNAIVYGNTWGSKGMRMYSTPNVGENNIENIVSSGKGLNFYASTTSTMGAPKMTILESSNVGIGTSQPQSRFQTSGGSAFINPQVTRRNNYNHLNTPLVVNNTTEISVINSTSNVMQLTREGTGSKYGARAAFKLGKWNMDDNKSKTRLDIDLADDNYAVDTNIITIRSDGKVGIGHREPDAYLEVKCEGVAQPGMLVHNHDSGDAIISARTDLATGNAFTSYVNGSGGWSAGVTDSTVDYRITENATEVSDVGTTALYISGSNRDVGIGTDAPRGKLEVNGDLVIGNKLTFGGLEGSLFGNTQFIERRYGEDQAINELVIYKGNKGIDDEGPTRIRHIAAEHIFQSYTDQIFNLTTEIGLTENNETEDLPLRITTGGAVIIGGKPNTTPSDVNNKLVVAGNIEFTAGGQFKLTGIEFETTNPESTPSLNKYRNVYDPGTATRSAGPRPMSFIHETAGGTDVEFARFDGAGRLGIGTETVSSNIHVYDSRTTDLDMLRLESPGTNKKTGMLLYTTAGNGGYVRGFSNLQYSTSGITIGAEKSSVKTDGINIINTSNVGIGTVNPLTKFHVYNGVPRVEHSSANAIIEFKTTGGTSNILSDTLGNVYINPESTETFINSNLTIANDITVGGNIDLGNAVAIDLGGDTANTALQVGGGIITNSNQVACKRYANTFERTFGESQDVQIVFGTGSFYAKIVAVLRRVKTTSPTEYNNMSTLVVEVQGGSHDGSTSDVDLAIGTKNIFGGTNDYPWSSTITTGKTGIVLNPYQTTDASGTKYSYDISVELMSSRNGELASIRTNSNVGDNPGPDNTESTEITSFDY
jgi:hypothetical protein